MSRSAGRSWIGDGTYRVWVYPSENVTFSVLQSVGVLKLTKTTAIGGEWLMPLYQAIFFPNNLNDSSASRCGYILEKLHTSVYVDWADPEMQHPTDRKTAEALKDRLKKYDKFIFLASDAVIHSEWCNWEIGYGDAQKYDTDKIALFPIKQDSRKWEGNEYLQLYPSIEYFDGTTRYSNTHEIIPEGFYVKYYYRNNNIIPLWDWLKR